MNRFLKPLNSSRKESSFEKNAKIDPEALFTPDGKKVCSDYKVINNSAEDGYTIVKYDNYGIETGREKSDARDLYEMDLYAADIKSANSEECAFLFNNLHPPKNASKEERMEC